MNFADTNWLSAIYLPANDSTKNLNPDEQRLVVSCGDMADGF